MPNRPHHRPRQTVSVMMGVTYKGRRYVASSEAALIALITWLQLADIDEQRTAA
jgi:hypothetical protein